MPAVGVIAWVGALIVPQCVSEYSSASLPSKESVLGALVAEAGPDEVKFLDEVRKTCEQTAVDSYERGLFARLVIARHARSSDLLRVGAWEFLICRKTSEIPRSHIFYCDASSDVTGPDCPNPSGQLAEAHPYPLSVRPASWAAWLRLVLGDVRWPPE